MKNSLYFYLAIFLGKTAGKLTRIFGKGQGTALPGLIAEKIDKNILEKFIKQLEGSIVISGTNGKTTTSRLISTILESPRLKIIHNQEGSNLERGLISSFLKHSSWGKIKKNFGVFEIDEAALPGLLPKIKPKIVVLLNLFRDQLDRYGEIDSIIHHWQSATEKLSSETKFIINADDQALAYLGEKLKKVYYFGLNQPEKGINHLPCAADSIFCFQCGSLLNYRVLYFSHLGEWFCPQCKRKRPELSLSSLDDCSFLPCLYNQYNLLAAFLAAQLCGFKRETIQKKLKSFKPVFGRGEEILINGKKIFLMLSKNPAGFNANIKELEKEKKKKNFLLILNDRIPDGQDVSWIWDVDFENLISQIDSLIISGDRAKDLALRLKYSGLEDILVIEKNIKKALQKGLEQAREKLYVLPTYSAMLEVRKILVNKKFS